MSVTVSGQVCHGLDAVIVDLTELREKTANEGVREILEQSIERCRAAQEHHAEIVRGMEEVEAALDGQAMKLRGRTASLAALLQVPEKTPLADLLEATVTVLSCALGEDGA